MDSHSKKQVDNRKKDKFFLTPNGKHLYSYPKATCKNIQRHWDFNKEYASYSKGTMDSIFKKAKRLCKIIKR